jgi:hypothetical protein
MTDVERSIVPSQSGPIYQIKFPEMKESYLFQTHLWEDITFKFNEEIPEKSFFIKETVRAPIPIQYCEFREMKDISNNPILILGSEKVTDMPTIFVGMASLPIDNECRKVITETLHNSQEVAMNN